MVRILTWIVVATRRTCTAGCMRGQYALVDKRLQTSSTIANWAFPVLWWAATANILKFTRRVPGLFVLYASATTTAAQSHLMQLSCRCFATNRQHILTHWHFGPIAHRTRRRVMIWIVVLVIMWLLLLLLLLFILWLHLNLLMNVGCDLFGCRLLDDDRFESFGWISIARYDVAGDVAIAIDTNHRLHDVLHGIAGNDGHGNWNAYKFPTKSDFYRIRLMLAQLSRDAQTHHWLDPLSELVTILVNVWF